MSGDDASPGGRRGGEGTRRAPGSGGSGRISEFRRNREVDAGRRRRREKGYRRAILWGVAVSLVVHAVLVAVLSDQLYLPRMDVDGPRSPLPRTSEGIRVVRVEEPAPIATPPRPTPDPPEPVEAPEEESEPEATDPAAEPVPEDAGEADEDEGMTNAERLRPREGDPRLWRRFWDEDRRRYVGGSARLDSAVRAILGEYFDSLALAREAYEDARDWTVGEGDERWGVSPEGIHLGDVTIPIPVNELLSPSGPRRRQLERELRELEAIQRQETLRDAEETREERLEEMRERSRERAGSDSTDTGDGG